MNKHAVLAFGVSLLMLVGCEEKKFDKRLVDVAVEQGKQEEDITRIENRIEGVDTRVAKIEQSLEEIAPALGAPEPPTTSETESSEPPVVEFKDTPEYKDISTKLSAIQQELNLARSNLASSRDAAASQEGGGSQADPAETMRAMSNPQELNNRLDSLVRNFSPKIEDPVLRQQFEMDVYQFRRNLSESGSPEQSYQRVVNDLTQRLNSEQNQRAQEWIKRELQSLQSASGDELAGRLERYQRMQTFRQVRELTSKYNIPRDVLSDSGLPAMGRGPRGERGGGGPGGFRSR